MKGFDVWIIQTVGSLLEPNQSHHSTSSVKPKWTPGVAHSVADTTQQYCTASNSADPKVLLTHPAMTLAVLPTH